MRNMLKRVAAEQKIRLTVAVETNSMDVQQRLAAAGVGFPPRLVEFVGNLVRELGAGGGYPIP